MKKQDYKATIVAEVTAKEAFLFLKRYRAAG